jgi:hypothetical protein
MYFINILRKLKKIIHSHNEESIFYQPVFDIKTDNLLHNMGKDARKILEGYSLKDRKKVLYFPGYYQSKFLAINDATMILALQIRGAEVIPVLSGYFYQQEDVIYGGVYNKDRYNLQYRYAQNENILLTSLLQTEPVSLESFSDKRSIENAQKVVDSVTFNNITTIKYKGIDIGTLAEKSVLNMNVIVVLKNEDYLLNQLKWHIFNIVRLIDTIEKIFDSVQPDVVVSNCPFYYKWNIPYKVASTKRIDFYSFLIGEKENSFYWSKNYETFYKSAQCWESYFSSGIYKKYNDLITADIQKRKNGDVSHIKYLKTYGQQRDTLMELKKKIYARPTVIFPVNALVDATVFVAAKTFSTCLNMVKEVVEYFKANPQYVCLMKAHPVEKIWLKDYDSYKLKNILEREKIKLPENIIFIDNDSDLSSFDLYDIVNGLIAYSSTTCIEFSWTGKRSISVLENVHYACAGFTYIPNSRNDFFNHLQLLLSNEDIKPSDSNCIRELGRAYYFLYYHIILTNMKLFSGNDLGTVPTKLLYNSLDALKEGSNDSLDYICDAILSLKPIFGENRWPPVTL